MVSLPEISREQLEQLEKADLVELVLALQA